MLLSRAADSLYWISRYLERAEHASRVIDVRLDLGLDRKSNTDGWDFRRLYSALQMTVPVTEPPRSPAALIDHAVFDHGNPESVASSITSARENARQVREEISSEMWEHLNGLFLRLKQAEADGVWSARPHYVLRLVLDGVHLFHGITDATMAHGEGWHYLQVGRFIERAASVAKLLHLSFGDPRELEGGLGTSEHREWLGLLRSCSALEPFCRCYTADLRRERIAEFLLLNAEFPRSVRFAAARIEASVRTIAQLTGRSSGERAERVAGRLHATLDFGQVDEILSDDPQHYVDGIVRYCNQINTALHQSYMSYPIETALPV